MKASRKIADSLVFFLTAGAVSWALLFRGFPLIEPLSNLDYALRDGAVLSPLLLIAAGILLFFRPRLGYGLALGAGLIALAWFGRSELSYFGLRNSWIVLNLPDSLNTEVVSAIANARATIIAVALTVLTLAWSALRVIPVQYKFRQLPLRERTWPAFTVAALFLTVWFSCAVTPYRIPIFVDGPLPQFVILHVEKRGFRFHETSVSLLRDSRFFLVRTDRRLFRYRFSRGVAEGIMSPALFSRGPIVARSLQSVRTGPATTLRAWNAEGWYVFTPQSGVLAFTAATGATVPPDMSNLLRELESAPTFDSSAGQSKDVCLGFCYDPIAALGFAYINERCRSMTSEMLCKSRY